MLKSKKDFTDASIEWKNMTVRHFLAHTSGMTDHLDDLDFQDDYTEDAFYRKMKFVSLAFRRSEQWTYCNFGYPLIEILITRFQINYTVISSESIFLLLLEWQPNKWSGKQTYRAILYDI